MAKVQIKRGLQENISRLVLDEGELAVALDTGNVYVGTTAGTTHVNPPTAAAESADKLKTERNFSISGDGTASPVGFDGTKDVTLVLDLKTMTGLTAGTYTKITIDTKGRVIAAENISAGDLPEIPAAKITGLGTAALLDGGESAGQVVVIGQDGKISDAVIPALAISETFEAGSQTEMLALNAQRGDVCIRTDEGKSYILSSSPASTLANWKWLKTPDCKVNSVNGKTGTVVITVTDIGAVPTSRTVNGKALSADITLSAGDVGSAPSGHTSLAAGADTLGHVKPGDGLTVAADGTLSVGDIDGGTF